MAVVQVASASCDPALLAELVRFCLTAVGRHRELASQVAPEHVQVLIAAVATAPRRIHDAGMMDVMQLRALVAALDALGVAAMPIYEQGRRDGRS
jgi:hypothetical protein